MSDEPENLTLKMLRELKAKIAELEKRLEAEDFETLFNRLAETSECLEAMADGGPW